MVAEPWFEGLDLGDEINPGDIEICTHPDGSEWKLGEGAFGTVPPRPTCVDTEERLQATCASRNDEDCLRRVLR